MIAIAKPNSRKVATAPALTREDVPSSVRGSWRHDRGLWVIIALAALLGLIYNFVILRGFGPDEMRHMAYVRLLFEEHSLPFLQSDGSEYRGAHSLHPPLYYLLLVPFYAVAHGIAGEAGWHVVRVVSLVLCLASLPLLYEVALRISGERMTARLAVAQLALLPMFGMTAGAINNDSSSLLAFSFFLWLLVVRLENDESWRSAAWLGLALGLGSLCKATVVIADAGALAVFWLNRRGVVSAGIRIIHAAILGVVAAILGGPWYGRNYALYGKFSPIESGYTNPMLPSPDKGVLVMMMHDNFPPLFAVANWSLFFTLWSQKDWIPEGIRTPIYLALLIYCVLATGGQVVGWYRGRGNSAEANDDPGGAHDVVARAGRRAAYGAFALSWLACLFMALFRHWGWAEGGRYLLASLFGLSLFLALGWRHLMGASRLQLVLQGWCAFALALNAVTIYWLLAYLNPTFGPK